MIFFMARYESRALSPVKNGAQAVNERFFDFPDIRLND